MRRYCKKLFNKTRYKKYIINIEFPQQNSLDVNSIKYIKFQEIFVFWNLINILLVKFLEFLNLINKYEANKNYKKSKKIFNIKIFIVTK